MAPCSQHPESSRSARLVRTPLPSLATTAAFSALLAATALQTALCPSPASAAPQCLSFSNEGTQANNPRLCFDFDTADGKDTVSYISKDNVETRLHSGPIQAVGLPGNDVRSRIRLPDRVRSIAAAPGRFNRPEGAVLVLGNKLYLLTRDAPRLIPLTPPKGIESTREVKAFSISAAPLKTVNGRRFFEVGLFSQSSPEKDPGYRMNVFLARTQGEPLAIRVGAVRTAGLSADELAYVRPEIGVVDPKAPVAMIKYFNGIWAKVDLNTFGILKTGDIGARRQPETNPSRLLPGPRRAGAEPAGNAEGKWESGPGPEPVAERVRKPLSPEQIARLQAIEPAIHQHLIGSSFVARSVSDAFHASADRDGDLPSRPLVFLAPAESGNESPEELARALASSYYEDPGAVEEISLSSVTGPNQTSNFMGSGKGYRDSEKPGALEKAVRKLRDRKHGGVLLIRDTHALGSAITEFSGAAGFKHGFLEDLANIIKSGEVESIKEGKPLDIRNITIVITGKEADDLYHQRISDGRRQLEYGRHESPGKVRDLLASSSFPTELLDTVATDYFLFEPRTREAIRDSAGRILEASLAHYEREYGIRIQHDPELATRLVDLFFSNESGMGGLRQLIEGKVRGLVSRAVMPLLAERKNGGQVAGNPVIRLELQDGTIEGKRVITLRVHRDGSGKQDAPAQTDLTPYAGAGRLLGLDDPNPLTNGLLMERLENLETRMKAQVIDQDEIIEEVARAARGKFLKPSGVEKPLFFLMVGRTGTGKSETPKALARALFDSDSPDFFDTVGMGDYQHEVHLDEKFFGTKDKMGLFEEKLRKLKHGGVLTLDEFSNMGGPDPARKKAMVQRFYDMKGEGFWQSPYGKKIRYPLGNIIFFATGNDGEKLFQGENDDIGRVMYEEYRPRDRLEGLLREAGLTEAFLGRLDGVYLSKPQTVESLARIARTKFLEPLLEDFRKTYPTLEVRPSPDFDRQIARSFKNGGQGARAMLTLIERDVGGAIGNAVTQLRPTLLKGGKATLDLTLTDTLNDRPYDSPKAPKRKVLLQARFSATGSSAPGELTIDLTGNAPAVRRLAPTDAVQTAFHEAGHAVVHDPNVLGMTLEFINIQPHADFLGYARYASRPALANPHQDRKFVIHELAVLMGGQLAVMKAGFPKNTGWSSDLQQIHRIINHYLVDAGMAGGLTSVRVDKEGKPILNEEQSRIFQAESDKLMREAFHLADQTLDRRWGKVVATATLLTRRGAITGDEFRAIPESGPRREPAGEIRAPRPTGFRALLAQWTGLGMASGPASPDTPGAVRGLLRDSSRPRPVSIDELIEAEATPRRSCFRVIADALNSAVPGRR